jgi:hypothetical protein
MLLSIFFCLRLSIRAALVFSFLGCLGYGQERIPPKLLELIKGPDRHDIPNKIELSKPMLMFQQQYLLRVGGSFSKKVIEHGEVQHVQVLTKVQDSDGQWLEGEDFDDFDVPPHLHGKNLYYSTALYLRPGRYRVAVVMYEVEKNKADVYHHDVVVEPLKNDPFPDIDAALPPVEFPERVDGHRGFWRLADKIRPIPVAKAKHTRLDVVLNITKRFRWDVLYRIDVQTMLESGSLLGRLRPENGCVRVSVIDALRLRVLLDRFPAEKLNWPKLQDAIERVDQDVIDVKVLSNQQRVAAFTHDYLQQLANDKQSCGPEKTAVTPMVVVVSPDVILPDGNRIGDLTPLEHNLYVYLHVGYGSGWSDGIGQILSSGKPQKMSCTNPHDFRNAMAKIASGMSGVQE